MSEARPITSVTEYVCSQCWTSFGGDDARAGAGVVTCPHCGHKMPADGGSVLDAVRSAPRAGDDSGGVVVPAVARDPEPSRPASVVSGGSAAAVISETFGGDHEPTDIHAAPTGGVVAAPGAAGGDAITAALAAAADAVDAAEPVERPTEPTVGVRTTGKIAPGSLGVHIDDDDEVDFDDVNEKTLDRAALLEDPMAEAAAAVSAPSLADAFDAAAAGVEVHVMGSSEQLAAVPVETAAVLAGAAAGPAPDAPPAGPPPASGPADGGPPYEEREWKLRAFGGITYNFHGLDAMLGWASSKAGSPMSVSVDGEEWRDFDPFYAALRDGLDAEQAYRAAGGERVEPTAGSSVLDEIAAHDAAHPDAEPTVTRATGEVPDEVRQTAKRNLSSATGRFNEVITEGEKARRERGEPARRGDRKARDKNGRTGKFKSTTRSDRAQRNTGSVRKVPGKTPRGGSKSGKRPAPASDNRLALGVGAALLVTVVVVFILHQQGVVVLPFLPR